MKIGLLSDTHGFLDDRIIHHLADCQEIWHAGDIGPGVADQLSALTTLRAVFGNIDNAEVRNQFPEFLELESGGIRILLTHIAGKPPSYNKVVRTKLDSFKPQVLICGHSHIACVIKDHKRQGLIFMNPGAAGIHGFHQMRTMMTFKIESGKMQELAVIELGKRGEIRAPLT